MLAIFAVARRYLLKVVLNEPEETLSILEIIPKVSGAFMGKVENTAISFTISIRLSSSHNW
jgi:hypothetical protein